MSLALTRKVDESFTDLFSEIFFSPFPRRDTNRLLEIQRGEGVEKMICYVCGFIYSIGVSWAA